MKFILIAATGRSGSTTLQRIINTIPNTNISGENWGAINDLLSFYQKLKKTYYRSWGELSGSKKELYSYQQVVEKNIKPCWYNCFDFSEMKNKLRELIIKFIDNENQNTIIGFKEIRYLNNTHLLDEFIELFPNTKIICHIRKDIVKQSQSDWLAENSQESLANLKKENQQLKDYSKNTYCYLSTFENLFNFDEIEKLFLFLEEKINKQDYLAIINKNLF